MGGDGGEDALAAGKARAKELVGVGAVDLGAGWASCGPAGAARLEQHPIRLTGRVEHGVGFAGLGVDVINAAQQAHGSLAVAGGADLSPPLGVADRVAAAGAQLGKEPVADRGPVWVLVGGCGWLSALTVVSR